MKERVVIDGRAIASQLAHTIQEQIRPLGRTPLVQAVVVSPTPATESYLRIKTQKAKAAGMHLEVVRLPATATQEEVMTAAQGSGADALIVQLPLPEHLDGDAILDAIPLTKDADVLSRQAYERFLNHEAGALMPPVVAAVCEILATAGVELSGKRAVVVGNGRLVGAPVRSWLAGQGAAVTTLTEETFATGKTVLMKADIIVSGAGSPRLIRPEMVAPGAVLIDAGTSESNGAIVGDFDPACAETASVFTPVPGGVGPVAVASLFRNVATLLL